MSIINQTLINADAGLNMIYVTFSFQLSGNYGTGSSHGDTLSFNTMPLIQSNSVPIWAWIFEYAAAGVAPNGYVFGYGPGTSRDNGVMTIFNNLAEYTPGSAYSAGLLAAVMRCVAAFPRGV